MTRSTGLALQLQHLTSRRNIHACRYTQIIFLYIQYFCLHHYSIRSGTVWFQC